VPVASKPDLMRYALVIELERRVEITMDRVPGGLLHIAEVLAVRQEGVITPAREVQEEGRVSDRHDPEQHGDTCRDGMVAPPRTPQIPR